MPEKPGVYATFCPDCGKFRQIVTNESDGMDVRLLVAEVLFNAALDEEIVVGLTQAHYLEQVTVSEMCACQTEPEPVITGRDIEPEDEALYVDWLRAVVAGDTLEGFEHFLEGRLL